MFTAGTLSLLSPSSGRIGSKEPRRAPAGSQYLLVNIYIPAGIFVYRGLLYEMVKHQD